MDSERVKEIFAGALRQPSAAERENFLEQACQGDLDLRQQVESLLHAHEQAGDFLEQTIQLPPADLEPEPIGSVIGRYKLLEKIGEGGFGVVYMAEQHEPLQRKVALKIIKAGMDTREVIARFEAERQALALMDHPNIAKVLDAGATEAKRPYFVMELVRGIPITEYCDQARLSTTERLQLFIKVCQAVQHAHQKAVIHRDLKPSNILVTLHDGEAMPKVIDFGVAKALGQKLTEKTLFTSFRQMIGTPAYMSPEQAEMSGLDIDTRSDIYSLGVLLYELLTGVTPFDKETLARAALDEIRRMIRETEPPKPSTRLRTLGEKLSEVSKHRRTEPGTLGRLVRGDLDWIVMKCLEKDRTRRFETIDGLMMDIKRHLHHEPVTAVAPGLVYQVRKFVWRHRVGIGMATMVLAALLTGLVVSVWQAVRATKAEAKEKREYTLSEQLRSVALKNAQENREHMVELSIAQGDRLVDEGDYAAALPWFTQALELDKGRPDREWVDRVRLAQVLHRCPRLLEVWFHPSQVLSAAFSSDGSKVLTVCGSLGFHGEGETTAYVWDVNRNQYLVQLPRLRDSTLAFFSPDGQSVGTISNTDLLLSSSISGQQFVAPLIHEGHVVSAAFGAGGSRLVSIDSRGPPRSRFPFELHLWDAVKGKALLHPLRHDGREADGLLSRDGTKILSFYTNWVQIWNAVTEAPIGSRLEHNRNVTSARFSPDGHIVVTTSEDGSARLWEAGTGIAITPRLEHQQPVTDALFSADGHHLLTAALADGEIIMRLWDPQAGQTTRPPLQASSGISSYVFSPDGRYLAAANSPPIVHRVGGQAALWDTSTGQRILSTMEHALPILSLSFRPDSRCLASASLDQTVRLWSVPGGQQLTPPLKHGDFADQVSFHPDGHRLLSASYDGTARLWETAIKPLVTLHHGGPIYWATFSPDGRRVATASSDGSARIWAADTGQELAAPMLHSGYVEHVSFSPDGQQLVTASADKTARVWSALTGQPITPLLVHTEVVEEAIFNQEGTRVYTKDSRGGTFTWDARTGKAFPESDRGKNVRLDVHWVRDAQADAVSVWDRSKPDWPMRQGRTRAVAISPDRHFMLTIRGGNNREGQARIWNTTNGEPTTLPMKHKQSIRDASFSPDGRLVATASDDGTARVWSAETGEPVTLPITHAGWVYHATFDASGTRVVTCSADSTAIVCDLVPDERPVEVLVVLSRLFSGCRIDGLSATVALTRDELETAWNALHGKLRETSPCNQAELVDWHLHELEASASLRNWSSALFHAEHALLLNPGDVALRRRHDAVTAMTKGAPSVRERIPPRAPGTSTKLLDLSDFFNDVLDIETDSAAVQLGVRKLGDVGFDLRGVVQLAGLDIQRNRNDLPVRIDSIPIQQACNSLHFLQAASWRSNAGTLIGRYVVNYADGQQAEIPIVYGEDTSCWGFYDPGPMKNATVALFTTTTGNVQVRLFKRTWQNPRPEVRISSLDFVSNMADAGPLLVALRLE